MTSFGCVTARCGSSQKTHITPLLAIESPVAQWLEHPTRSRRVMVQIPSGTRIFSESMSLDISSKKINFCYEIPGFIVRPIKSGNKIHFGYHFREAHNGNFCDNLAVYDVRL